MQLNISQQMRMSQQLKLSPQMRLRMEILQLPTLALEERIEEKINENIVLERVTEDADAPETETQHNNEADFERWREMFEQCCEQQVLAQCGSHIEDMMKMMSTRPSLQHFSCHTA